MFYILVSVVIHSITTVQNKKIVIKNNIKIIKYMNVYKYLVCKI